MLFKDLKLEEVNSTIEDLTRVFDGLNVVRASELTAESMKIALKNNVTIYDALYIASAEKISGTLYTADQKLCNSAKEITNTKILKSTEQ